MSASEISSVSAAQQGALLTKIAALIAKKQLDAASAQGEALVALLQAAASAGRAPDRGEHVDLSA
jgi:hypothetical protein